MRNVFSSTFLAAAFAAVLAFPTTGAAVAGAAASDPALAAILAKADAAAAAQEEAAAAPAIEAAAIAGDWQLARVDALEAPYLYVDSTLHFAADGTVTIRQQLKNRDRTDDWTATVPGAQDRAGAWQFTPADEVVTIRSYEDRPAPKTDLEDQIAPWRFRYDEADHAGNHETHARTVHRSYQVAGLENDTLTVALTYSDSDGCDPRTVTLAYTRGLHVVTDADRAAQQALDTPWKTSKEAAAEEAAKAEEQAAAKKAEAQKAKEAAKQEKAERKKEKAKAENPVVAAAGAQAADPSAVPELRMTM